MEGIIDAIHALKQRDTWDYIAIFAPLILSSVAIWISIRTTKKQNKIALFERRFEIFNILGFLLSTTKKVVSNKKQEKPDFDTWEILAQAMQTYKFCSSPFDTEINYSHLDYFYTNLVLTATKASCLFGKIDTDTIVVFLETFSSLCSDIRDGNPYNDKVETLGKIVDKIEKDKTMIKLEKCLKL